MQKKIDEILAGYDDWRVLVASPGVTFSRSRLPEKPFSSDDLRQRIARRRAIPRSQIASTDTVFLPDRPETFTRFHNMVDAIA